MITLPDYKPEYSKNISKSAYLTAKIRADEVLARLAKIYEAYTDTGNEALIDSFKQICLELHRYTKLLAYADSKAYWELGEKVFGKGEMLIELGGAIANDALYLKSDAL